MDKMESPSLITKKAISQEGKILGEIIRLEGKQEAKVIVDQLRVVIKVERTLKEPDLIQIPVEKIISVIEDNVQIDIPFKKFKELQELYRFERKRKLKSEKDRELIEEGYKKAVSKTLSQRYF
ncbi:MAG: hypothetical protein FK731_05045 [Asgard group archaeon]|nr:hypothetical protein [Asgard group archaeon]